MRTTKIRRSLILMLLLKTGTVVVLTTPAFSAYEFVTARQLASGNLATLGKMIAANSTARWLSITRMTLAGRAYRYLYFRLSV